MMNLIPTRASAARGLLLAILVLVVLAGAAAAGAVVNGWRLTSAHQSELASREAIIARQAKTILEQSNAVDLARVKTEEGEQRRIVAERYATDVIRQINRRSEQVAQSKATDCKGVLAEAWGAQ